VVEGAIEVKQPYLGDSRCLIYIK